jgi:hypothetical protein
MISFALNRGFDAAHPTKPRPFRNSIPKFRGGASLALKQFIESLPSSPDSGPSFVSKYAVSTAALMSDDPLYCLEFSALPVW